MSKEIAQALARRDFNKGLGLEENPYSKDSPDYEAYMWEMHRLQNEEFKQECLDHGY